MPRLSSRRYALLVLLLPPLGCESQECIALALADGEHFVSSCDSTPLETPKNAVRWEFSDFFVIKESLALMYKELQLPAEALLKYQVRPGVEN